MELLLDENRGIYIPQVFAQTIDLTKVKTLDHLLWEFEVLNAGPDHPDYWEAWDTVIDELEFTDGSTLYQDGDLWILAKDETPVFE